MQRLWPIERTIGIQCRCARLLLVPGLRAGGCWPIGMPATKRATAHLPILRPQTSVLSDASRKRFEKGLIVSCHKMVTLSGPIHFRDRWHSPVGPLPIGSACSVEDSKKKSTLPRFNGSSGSRPSTTRWRWRWPRGILFFRYSVVSAIEFQPSLSFR